MGHGGASKEDDKAKDRDGEVRGGQSTHSNVSTDSINMPCDNNSWNSIPLTPNKRHLGRFAIVGVEVNALVGIRVPAFFASVLPQP
jgi:hypothetical protein